MSYVTHLSERYGQVTARVTSRTTRGVSYSVTLYLDKTRPTRGSSRCSCKAGQVGRQCWHVSAVRDAYNADLAESRSLYGEVLTAARLYEGADADEVCTLWDVEMDRHHHDHRAATRALHQRFCGPGTVAYKMTQMTA